MKSVFALFAGVSMLSLALIGAAFPGGLIGGFGAVMAAVSGTALFGVGIILAMSGE